uniref:Uncharacterized protein n=1 Tax=Romanomermis culicivorax TaxID=13658 RepID=A0A915HXR0_ROMCU
VYSQLSDSQLNDSKIFTLNNDKRLKHAEPYKNYTEDYNSLISLLYRPIAAVSNQLPVEKIIIVERTFGRALHEAEFEFRSVMEKPLFLEFYHLKNFKTTGSGRNSAAMINWQRETTRQPKPKTKNPELARNATENITVTSQTKYLWTGFNLSFLLAPSVVLYTKMQQEIMYDVKRAYKIDRLMRISEVVRKII